MYTEVSKIAPTMIYLDDNKRLDYPKGIVVNGSIYAQKLQYQKRRDVTYLLGTEYLPLRKEFWRAGRKAIKREVASIMVTFGSDDPRGMTWKVVKILASGYPRAIKRVIVGEDSMKKT